MRIAVDPRSRRPLEQAEPSASAVHRESDAGIGQIDDRGDPPFLIDPNARSGGSLSQISALCAAKSSAAICAATSEAVTDLTSAKGPEKPFKTADLDLVPRNSGVITRQGRIVAMTATLNANQRATPTTPRAAYTSPLAKQQPADCRAQGSKIPPTSIDRITHRRESGFALFCQPVDPSLVDAVDYLHRLGVACPFGVIFADPSNLRARSIRRDRNRR